jgi:hypothetical protein
LVVPAHASDAPDPQNPSQRVADLDGDGRGELLAASMLDNVLVVTRLPR